MLSRLYSRQLFVVFVFALAALTLVVQNAANAGSSVKSGTFEGASNHVTKGGVSVVKDGDKMVLVLAADFSLDGAPDPVLGFGKNGTYDKHSKVSPLNANKGGQSYDIPSEVNVTDYNEIYVWCERYSVPLGVAKLN